MTFDVAQRQFASLLITDLQGEECAGFYRLRLRIDLTVAPWPEVKQGQVVLTDLGGRLVLECRDMPGLLELGVLRPLNHPIHYEACAKQYNYTEWMYVDLARASLEALENARAGGDLSLTAHLVGRVVVAGIPHQVTENHMRREIQSGTWVRLLGQMGYGRYLSFEIPIPSVPGHVLGRPASLLVDAQRAITEGRWRDAVATCREVLEAAEHALGDVGTRLPEKRERTVPQRMFAIRQALKDLCSLAVHQDQLASDAVFSMSAARAVVAATASMFALFEHAVPLQNPET